MSDIKTEQKPVTRHRVIGAAGDTLIGYDIDGVCTVWQGLEEGRDAETGIDYPGGWWVDQFGFDVFWRDPDGKEIRP